MERALGATEQAAATREAEEAAAEADANSEDREASSWRTWSASNAKAAVRRVDAMNALANMLKFEGV
jgi:hypothetical protein